MAGFTSPTILFLNTWDKPERDWTSRLFTAALDAGYDRYVELYAGAFANMMVARASGWEPERMMASDVWLYSAALGYAYGGRDLRGLGVKADGKPLALSGEPAKDAATVIHAQYKCRLAKHEDTEYFRELIEDLYTNEDAHVSGLEARIRENRQRLDGIRFTSEDPRVMFREVIDDPHTLIMANPPTYKGAYEKFFDDGGRVTWNRPEYTLFDAKTDIPALWKESLGHKALFVVQQQQAPGKSADPDPVYARRLGVDSVVYMNANRPEEIRRLIGLNVTVPAAKQAPGIPVPLLPQDHMITDESPLEVVPCPSKDAQSAYLQVMRHRLTTAPSPLCALVLIDGMVAGIIGYDIPIPYHYSPETPSFAVLRQAFGSPHDSYRLTRLATMLSLQKTTLQMFANPKNRMRLDSTTGLRTVEYTRYPEAKGLRGLMKLVGRKRSKGVYNLTYYSPWHQPRKKQEILADWLKKEEKRHGR